VKSVEPDKSSKQDRSPDRFTYHGKIDKHPLFLHTIRCGMEEVYLVKPKSRGEAVEMLSEASGVDISGKKVIVKANYNSADPFPASTHKDTLLSLVQVMNRQDPISISLLERSGMGNTRRVLEQCGVYDMLGPYGSDIVVLDDLSSEQWQHIEGKETHWRKGFWLPRQLLQAGAVVQTCCLKTHRFGGHFTLSLKNSVGLVAKTVPGNPHNFMSELHSSPDQRLMIAEINHAYQTDLVILDAMEAFVRGGPEQGVRVSPGLMLAGRDRVAVDAAGVALLREYGTTPEVAGGKIFGLEQISRAVELGIGTRNPHDIEIIPLDEKCRSDAKSLTDILELEG
jgi:uncharacterized protein (DUF362 family)